jgi:A/G-specific adenine glycosylase
MVNSVPLLFGAAFFGVPAQIDILSAHFFKAANTLCQAQAMPFEYNRGYLPAQYLCYLSIASRAIEPLQNHDFFLGPARTYSRSFCRWLAGNAGSTTNFLHINILIGRKVLLAYSVPDCISIFFETIYFFGKRGHFPDVCFTAIGTIGPWISPASNYRMKDKDSRPVRIWAGGKNRKFRSLVLEWYEKNRRGLPWRGEPIPYYVWISEVMLQQTQVKTVVPYFNRFIRRFPDIAALAAAPEEEVVALWSGLGYYHRARNIHRAARIIFRDLGGKFPDSLDGIRQLPGIGRYSAAAIYSIAFNQPQAVVDGNVRRIITRLHAIAGNSQEEFFWHQMQAWQSEERPSDFTQAVMELGALVCKPGVPLCSKCPVQSLCRSYAKGIQDCVPAPRPKRALEQIDLVILVLESRGRVYLKKKQKADFVPGQWSLPTESLAFKSTRPEERAKALAHDILGVPIQVEEKKMVRHSITHRRIQAHVYYGDIGEYQFVHPSGGNFCLAGASRCERMITSSLYKKALRSAMHH